MSIAQEEVTVSAGEMPFTTTLLILTQTKTHSTHPPNTQQPSYTVQRLRKTNFSGNAVGHFLHIRIGAVLRMLQRSKDLWSSGGPFPSMDEVDGAKR